MILIFANKPFSSISPDSSKVPNNLSNSSSLNFQGSNIKLDSLS